MTQLADAQAQQTLDTNVEGQKLTRRLALRRVTSGFSLIAAIAVFLVWLPQSSRTLLLNSLIGNRLLIGLLFLFGLMAVSLLWSKGQVLDVWLFKALTLRRYSPLWMDRLMWVLTQIGNVGFAALVAMLAYVLGDHRFAIGFMLGSLSLLLLVTIIKAFTDRARPFNVLLETRVVGWREAGLSFPSGHTTQTFFMMTLIIRRFQLPLAGAAVLYGIAALVGITRVYLGVHYPRDVIAGIILGLIWGNIAASLAPYL